MFIKTTLIFGVLLLFTLSHAKLLSVRDTHDPGECSKTNRGELILVKDREEMDAILVCTENKGIYNWKSTDNTKSSGEYFKPGYDCLDILNKNTKAKDGYYWINFNGDRPIKVWCDMTTDGGGYMLIGHMNDTKTWDVPSSNKTVEPFGTPQWSSAFGDFPVLDFRIQVAADENFKNTKAHWAFRFKNRRLLKNLMIANEGGCPYNFAGVGNVSYVKNLITEEIVSKEFSCSIFGAYSHPFAKIGWTMMNFCLEKPCKNGYAYHFLYPIQVDFSGSFSFSSVGNSSEASSGRTAFFGCYKGKCCACYGPSGGRGVYCTKECQPINGGTVTKHASAWFWVRLNPPRKVWEKCMEYRSEQANGDSAWYKLVGDRNIPVRGRCATSESFMNDGVVVLKDGEALKNVPAISGLLAYRKDNQALHVRKDEIWRTIPEEEKINEQLTRINAVLKNFQSYTSRCMHLSTKKTDLSSGRYFIGSMEAYCDMPSGWTLVGRFSNKDAKHWIKDSNFWFDRISTYGDTLSPHDNADMISAAFWRIQGSEFKITRSDDSSHTALLVTTNNCLKGTTFREHIISVRNYHYQEAWASNKCQSNCNIRYGGKYQTTSGFEMHSCSGGIQSSHYIGFWCDYDDGDGAVMMIGGGGSGCYRADHGVGITEENAAKFGGSQAFLDFGYQKRTGSGNNEDEIEKAYALNLWVR